MNTLRAEYFVTVSDNCISTKELFYIFQRKEYISNRRGRETANGDIELCQHGS